MPLTIRIWPTGVALSAWAKIFFTSSQLPTPTPGEIQ